MIRRECTCAGTAPGYPQHESWCGQPEPEDTEEVDETDSYVWCGDRGPRIGQDGSCCAQPSGHDGQHRAHHSFGPNITWPALYPTDTEEQR